MLSKREGFTLIELTVVIVIVGILATSAVPKITAIIDQAAIASVRYGQAIARNAIMMKQGEDMAKFHKVIYVSHLDKSLFEGDRVPRNAFVNDPTGEFCWATSENFALDIDQLVRLGQGTSIPTDIDCTDPAGGPWSWLFIHNREVYPTFPEQAGYRIVDWE